MEHLEPGSLPVRCWGKVADGTTFTRQTRPGQGLFGKRRAYPRKVAVAEFEAVGVDGQANFQVICFTRG
jgi:type I restriction enzyme S subunit